MPIRFRCTYCDKLLGIAQRKAGQEVTCPKCKGRMRVPATEAEANAVSKHSRKSNNVLEASPSSSGNRNAKEYAVPSKLFENDDFDRLLSAGTLPGKADEGSSHIPSTPSIEKLAKESLANDRELFAIDLDAPPLPTANVEEALPVSGSGKIKLLLSLTALLFFALGVMAGYFAFKGK